MRTRIVALSVVLCCFVCLLQAQMSGPGGAIKYGNEWIDYSGTYYKIPVAKDGIYRISGATLKAAGIPIEVIDASRFQLFHLGEEVPIYVNSNTLLNDDDFLEFYGEKNRSQLDRHLYKAPEEDMLNPFYSLVTDTSAYFLTWSDRASETRIQQIDNDLSNLPPKEEWFWYDLTQLYTTELAKAENIVGVKKSQFQRGEGYSGGFEVRNNIRFEPTNVYPTTDSARVLLRFATNDRQHDLEIQINDQLRIAESFFGYALKSFDLGTLLSGNRPTVKVDLIGKNASNDRQALAVATLRYPRRFDFENADVFSFHLLDSQQRKYLEISNFNVFGGPPILYDLNDHQRILTANENGIVRVAIPPANSAGPDQQRRLVLVNGNTGIKKVEKLEKVNFINYPEAAYIIISHPLLYQTNSGSNPIQDYAAYRSSSIGGNFRTIIIDIQQLYDQFAYGVNRHYIALRNFGHFIHRNWPTTKYMFIIGKGMEFDQIRSSISVQKHYGKEFYIPTYGNPGADNLLLSDNFSSEPVIPIGRIAATSPYEVGVYLQKVKDFEANRNLPQTVEDRYWMKRVLHLGGGDLSIQETIRTNLTDLETLIKNSKFGGDVTSFYKESTDAIEVSRADQLFETINDGLSIITFYGHSGANSFDFNIDNPENYQNKNKYPILVSLGCYSGQIHNDFKGISERFVFSPNSGTIAFFASTGLGYISSLRTLSQNFYRYLGEINYGEGLGIVMKNTVGALDSIPFSSVKELSEQYTMHGDPAIVLNAHNGPDYTIDAQTVAFEPSVIDIQTDSFSLSFDLLNLGFHIEDSLSFQITQELPDGRQVKVKQGNTPTPEARATVEVKLPVLGQESVGLNTFYIKIDEMDDLAEQPSPEAESNNELILSSGERGIQIFILDNTINPVYPPDFGIVNRQSPTLYASTTNALAPNQPYLFEIDTTTLFNSPLKERTTITQKGGLVKWQPQLELKDQVVYYWRVSQDSLNEQVGYNWKRSSFTFLAEGTHGWSQSHYFQYLQDSLASLKVRPSSKFSFAANPLPFTIRNKLFDRSQPPRGLVNGSSWSDFFRWDIPGSVSVVVFDPTGQIRFNFKPGEFGSVNTSAARIGCYPFPADSYENRRQLIDFIENEVEDGSVVFLYTALRTEEIDLSIENWQQDSLRNDGINLFNFLEQKGARLIRNLEKEVVPYIFVFKKGGGPLREVLAENKFEEISAEYLIDELQTEGALISPLIGPSKNWGKLDFDHTYSSSPENDSISCSMWGYPNPEGRPALLWEGESTGTSALDLSFINANEYPYLQLRFDSFDETDKSAASLDFWRIFYEGFPELAVNPERHFAINQDTLQQGQPYRMEVAIENISAYDMDSLLLKYNIGGGQNVQESIVQRIAPVNRFSAEIAILNLATTDRAGLQSVLLEANPDEDQPELFHFNNFLQTTFSVQTDVTKPVLDVTFDGQHIMDGDLVSAAPLIQVSIIDENKYLSLNDTSSIQLFLEFPNGSVTQINATNPDVAIEFEREANRVNVFFTPQFLENGEYRLFANGKDASGNVAGNFDYQIRFEVITEKSISNLLNYPNPFSTSTQFVYTLTGSEPPAEFKIQIFTAAGTIVREIFQEELGELKIGTHRTEYSWDGTDTYGDPLANGIYLYRIIAKDENGKDYEAYDNGTGRFFQNGFGKMVLLR